MVIQGAAKAKVVVADASDGRHDLFEVPLLDGAVDSIGAVGGWAPLEVFLVVDIGAQEEISVSTTVSDYGHGHIGGG